MTPAVRALEADGITFELLEYPIPAAADIGMAAARALGLDSRAVFKTLIVELPERQWAVALVPVNTQLNLKRLARAAAVKSARISTPQDAERITGYLIGGICPIAQKRTLPTYIAEEIVDLEQVYLSAGRRGLELKMRPADLLQATGARVAPLT